MKSMEWIIFVIVSAYKIYFNFTGPDVMIYGPVTPDGKNIDKTCAWMSLNNMIVEKFQSELSVVAWIHSKFQGNEINSIDLHTQMAWSTMFPNILGLVVKLNEDGSKIWSFDLYALTMKGKRQLSKCKKSEQEVHDECRSTALYKSCIDYVKFIESPLEVLNDDYEVTFDDPMEIQSNDSQLDDFSTQSDDSLSDQSQNDDEFWRICKGCQKPFENPSKFCNHVSRAKCKESYGVELQEWKEKRKASLNR